MELQDVAGKTMDETKELDWLGYWPIIDADGIIQGLADQDTDTDDLTPVDWVDGKAVETDPDYGFDAFLK